MPRRSAINIFGLAVLAPAVLLSSPVFAGLVNTTEANILATALKAVAKKPPPANLLGITTITENPKDDIYPTDLGFNVRGGGTLVLCDPSQGAVDGKFANGGKCSSNTIADPKNPAAGGVSDILAFESGQKIITLYSDPPGLVAFEKAFDTSLAPASLKKNVGPTLDYVVEGQYYDETTGNFGTITDGNPGFAIYIVDRTKFARAFEIQSAPLPVPAPVIGHGLPGVLAIGGVLFGARLLFERSKNRRSLGTAIRRAA